MIFINSRAESIIIQQIKLLIHLLKGECYEHHTDPVCGMKVDSESRHSVEHAGERYYFCSQHCLEKFQKNPVAYINADVTAPAVKRLGRLCLHLPDAPEVVSAHPAIARSAAWRWNRATRHRKTIPELRI